MGYGMFGISPYFNITNKCREKLLKKNKHAKEIIIYKIFRYRPPDVQKEADNYKNNITRVFEIFFQLFYYRDSGIDKYTKVDVDGVCNEKIAIFFYDKIENNLLTTNIKNVQSQSPIKAPVEQFLKWYDILSPNSDFYNSICVGYTYNTYVDKYLKQETKLKYLDTSLDIRKKYFMGNLYLCPEFCSYSGIFSIMGNLLITCHCKDPHMDLLSSLTVNPMYKLERQYLQPFKYDEDEFFNKKKDGYFSLGVFGCFMFTFMYAFTSNYGSYITLGMGCVIVFSFVELLIFGKKRILSVFEFLYNNNIHIKDKSTIKGNLAQNQNNIIDNNDLISLSVKEGNEQNINIKKNINTSKKNNGIGEYNKDM